MAVAIQEFVLQPAPATPPPAPAASGTPPSAAPTPPTVQVQRAEAERRALALRTFAH